MLNMPLITVNLGFTIAIVPARTTTALSDIRLRRQEAHRDASTVELSLSDQWGTN
jgi:hypothetical protein